MKNHRVIRLGDVLRELREVRAQPLHIRRVAVLHHLGQPPHLHEQIDGLRLRIVFHEEGGNLREDQRQQLVRGLGWCVAHHCVAPRCRLLGGLSRRLRLRETVIVLGADLSREVAHVLVTPRAEVVARAEQLVVQRLAHAVLGHRHREQRQHVREHRLRGAWRRTRISDLEGGVVRPEELEWLGHRSHRRGRGAYLLDHRLERGQPQRGLRVGDAGHEQLHFLLERQVLLGHVLRLLLLLLLLLGQKLVVVLALGRLGLLSILRHAQRRGPSASRPRAATRAHTRSEFTLRADSSFGPRGELAVNIDAIFSI